jgi:hypothetical protein
MSEKKKIDFNAMKDLIEPEFSGIIVDAENDFLGGYGEIAGSFNGDLFTAPGTYTHPSAPDRPDDVHRLPDKESEGMNTGIPHTGESMPVFAEDTSYSSNTSVTVSDPYLEAVKKTATRGGMMSGSPDENKKEKGISSDVHVGEPEKTGGVNSFPVNEIVQTFTGGPVEEKGSIAPESDTASALEGPADIFPGMVRAEKEFMDPYTISLMQGREGPEGPVNIDGYRESGGSVEPGKNYLVGEKGPEILRMGFSPGEIIPNTGLGGGKNFNLTVNNNITIAAGAGNIEDGIVESVKRALDRLADSDFKAEAGIEI